MAMRLGGEPIPHMGSPTFSCKPEIVLQLLDIISGNRDTTITPERMNALERLAKDGYDLVNPAYRDLVQYVRDLEAAYEDKKRLTREIDVALNGTGAAKQASLCDILGQITDEGIRSKWHS